MEGDKQFIGVVLEVSPAGAITPKAILWPDGRRFEIDQVLAVAQAPAALAGALGMCYTCQVRTRQAKLYKDGDRWFMQAKGQGM